MGYRRYALRLNGFYLLVAMHRVSNWLSFVFDLPYLYMVGNDCYTYESIS